MKAAGQNEEMVGLRSWTPYKDRALKNAISWDPATSFAERESADLRAEFEQTVNCDALKNLYPLLHSVSVIDLLVWNFGAFLETSCDGLQMTFRVRDAREIAAVQLLSVVWRWWPKDFHQNEILAEHQ